MSDRGASLGPREPARAKQIGDVSQRSPSLPRGDTATTACGRAGDPNRVRLLRDVDRLVAASQQFINDVDLVQYGLQYSTSFTDKLTADVQNIQKYEAAVKRELERRAS